MTIEVAITFRKALESLQNGKAWKSSRIYRVEAKGDEYVLYYKSLPILVKSGDIYKVNAPSPEECKEHHISRNVVERCLQVITETFKLSLAEQQDTPNATTDKSEK